MSQMSVLELKELTADIRARRISAEHARARLESHRRGLLATVAAELPTERDADGYQPGVRIYCRQGRCHLCKAKHCSHPCHKKG